MVSSQYRRRLPKKCVAKTATKGRGRDEPAHAEKAKILVHSFWGLESPMELPPQVKMIGPVPAAGELAMCFREGHPELHSWLHMERAASSPPNPPGPSLPCIGLLLRGRGAQGTRCVAGGDRSLR